MHRDANGETSVYYAEEEHYDGAVTSIKKEIEIIDGQSTIE